MKRILSLIAFSILFTLTSFAQTRALATLSHGNQLRFFDNVSAFEDAVNAAVDGDIIYLSEGKFGVSTSYFTIKDKKISIVGCGYKSHIVANIEFCNSNIPKMTLTMPLFDGVRLEKLFFSVGSNGYTHHNIDRIEIKKCKIEEITLIKSIDNLFLDRCNINSYVNDYKNNNHIQLNNCKIRLFNGGVCELLENCNIMTILGYGPSYILNSIIAKLQNNKTTTKAHSTFENCAYMVATGYASSNVYQNCHSLSYTLLKDNLESNLNNPYVGTDGTVIGVYGGQWFPYSETPSVPTVDSSKSSVEYDKETNKLNVTITVAPN